MEKKKDQTVLDLDSMSRKDETINTNINCSRSSELIQEYNSCVLCGTELLFFHVTDFGDKVVLEETNCPSCNIKSKKKSHRLQ